MGGDKQIQLQGNSLQIPADAAKRLAESGKPLRLVFSTGRFLALAAGDPLFPEGKDGVPVLAGNLARIPPPDLFSFLTMTQKSGLLRFFTPQGDRSAYFLRGEIVFASSSAEQDRLGNFLYRRGLIEKKQLREIEKELKPGMRFGKAFVDKGYLDPKALWEAVRAQVEEVVYALFSLHDGDFVFIEGDSLLPEDLAGLSLSSQSLLMEGIRRSDESAMIAEVIPSDEAVPRRRENVPQTNLEESERKMLEFVDGTRDVRQIVRASKRGEFDVKRALYDLSKAKIIDIQLPGQPGGGKDAKTRMTDAIADYNKIFAQIYRDLKLHAKTIDVDKSLAAFFADLTGSRFAGVFREISVGADGTLDAPAVLANAEKLGQGGEGTALAIAGLGELLNYELLVDALSEFLNFEIFTVRKSCEDAQATAIIKKIRQIQSGQLS